MDANIVVAGSWTFWCFGKQNACTHNVIPAQVEGFLNAVKDLSLQSKWMYGSLVDMEPETLLEVLFGIKEKSGLADSLPKFLGFTLDPTLNWSPYIIGLRKKLSSSIYALKRLCGELDQDGLRQAYCDLFQCHMMYGLIA
ncbi:hypothetical protein J6590_077769 [Homalodisca vitripennis]|nr:hypothetical protein J6590_077769 [Homalodisca vitripennis]